MMTLSKLRVADGHIAQVWHSGFELRLKLIDWKGRSCHINFNNATVSDPEIVVGAELSHITESSQAKLGGELMEVLFFSPWDDEPSLRIEAQSYVASEFVSEDENG